MMAFALLFGGVYAAFARAQGGEILRTTPRAADGPAAFEVPVLDPSATLTMVGAVILFSLLNGAFSMAETAFTAVRPSRVDQLVEEGRRGATAVRRMLDSPARYYATTQVGIKLFGFAAAAAAATTLAPALARILLRGISDPYVAYWVAVALITFAVALVAMILGEIGPKSVALQAPDVWALRLAPFLNVCAVIFAPITSVAVAISSVLVRPFGAKAQFETPMITREEFEKIIDQGEKHGELDDDEAKIIGNVFDLSETPVRSVMTPRIDMTTAAVDASLSDLLDIILQSGHSRIPVYEGTIDNVVGIVHAKDLLPLFRAERRDVALRTVMRAPHFVPETKRVADLLEELRRSNQQLAIVQDEYAGTEGLVTIEDLLEEIVGDIRDEYDVDEPEVQVLSETESLIDGRMSIDDVNDRLGLDLPHKDYDTIGGLVFGLLGHEPAPGERVRYEGIEFLVEQIDGRRIRSLRAVRTPTDGAGVSATDGAEVVETAGI
jgi:CBS domain containing-hemolysin-like protein